MTNCTSWSKLALHAGFTVVLAVSSALEAGPATTPATNSVISSSSIPYVPTGHDVVRDLLWLANVGSNDVVYDLGSGDGRIVIAAVRDFHARRAVGIEASEPLVSASREQALKEGVADRTEFVRGDLFTNDFSAASVVVLYLGQNPNLDLRAKLVRMLRPGARVASHQFGMGEWPSDKMLQFRAPVLGMFSSTVNYFATNSDVPSYNDLPSHATHGTVSVWTIPAPVAGTWRGKADFGEGECELTFTLHQRLSGVSGPFELNGQTNFSGGVRVDLQGTDLRLVCISTNRPFGEVLRLDAVVSGDSLKGTLRLSQQGDAKKSEWTGQRTKGDYTGTWQWKGHNDRPVQLSVERRDGHLTASYFDEQKDVSRWTPKSKPVAIRDFYDFGGGFYFTVLLGLEGDNHRSSPRRMGPEDGWLVGEAILAGDSLDGSIGFYPYPKDEMPGLFPRTAAQPPAETAKAPSRTGRLEWRPTRLSR